MDLHELERRVWKLIDARQFYIAEAELHQARLKASNDKDPNVLGNVLSLLVELYRSMEPPDLAKAESQCLELEQVSGTGYAKLQTAMMLYWSMDSPSRTVAKAQDAITQASRERDDKTVYQSYGLLGLALLDLHQVEDAVRVLGEIERMVTARQRIVVGDETPFLERLLAQAREPKTRTTIQRIAKILWPVCREAAFAVRLRAPADLAKLARAAPGPSGSSFLLGGRQFLPKDNTRQATPGVLYGDGKMPPPPRRRYAFCTTGD